MDTATINTTTAAAAAAAAAAAVTAVTAAAVAALLLASHHICAGRVSKGRYSYCAQEEAWGAEDRESVSYTSHSDK